MIGRAAYLEEHSVSKNVELSPPCAAGRRIFRRVPPVTENYRPPTPLEQKSGLDLEYAGGHKFSTVICKHGKRAADVDEPAFHRGYPHTHP